jgi:hypothetical protein
MSLSLGDQVKVLNAGFRIFRFDLIRKQITEAKSAGGWAPYGNYKTKNALLKVWAELMQDEKNISG